MNSRFTENEKNAEVIRRSIGKETLIEEIYKQTRLNLDLEAVDLDKPLKEIGEHKVAIKALNKKVDLTVVVEGTK